jgi:hypothetical protein
VHIWRKHRALTIQSLAAAAQIGPSNLTEIQTHRKPGNLNVMIKIAAACKIPLDDVTAWLA